jgi:hypothetical protein
VKKLLLPLALFAAEGPLTFARGFAHDYVPFLKPVLNAASYVLFFAAWACLLRVTGPPRIGFRWVATLWNSFHALGQAVASVFPERVRPLVAVLVPIGLFAFLLYVLTDALRLTTFHITHGFPYEFYGMMNNLFFAFLAVLTSGYLGRIAGITHVTPDGIEREEARDQVRGYYRENESLLRRRYPRRRLDAELRRRIPDVLPPQQAWDAAVQKRLQEIDREIAEAQEEIRNLQKSEADPPDIEDEVAALLERVAALDDEREELSPNHQEEVS